MARFVFTLADGFNFRRRSIGFVQELERNELDAKVVFDSLGDKDSALVKSRFDQWLQREVFRKYFHGFDNPDYRKCFVFKWEKRRKPQRLYGFLCHPKPSSDPGFELCVLVYFATKDDVTDYALLDRVNALRGNLGVTEAIASEYPEYGRTETWTN